MRLHVKLLVIHVPCSKHSRKGVSDANRNFLVSAELVPGNIRQCGVSSSFRTHLNKKRSRKSYDKATYSFCAFYLLQKPLTHLDSTVLGSAWYVLLRVINGVALYWFPQVPWFAWSLQDLGITHVMVLRGIHEGFFLWNSSPCLVTTAPCFQPLPLSQTLQPPELLESKCLFFINQLY